MRRKKYYRLVKVENTYVTRNVEGIVDFMPELYVETTYEIEEKIGFFGEWITMSVFGELKKNIAEMYLNYYKSEPKRKVIK